MLIATGAGVLATGLAVVVVIITYLYVKLNNRMNEIERMVAIRQQIQQPIVAPTNPAVIKEWDIDKKFTPTQNPVAIPTQRGEDFLKAMDGRIERAIHVSDDYHQSRDIQSARKDPKEDYVEKMNKRVERATTFLKDNGLDRVEVAPTVDVKPDSLLKLRRISVESKPVEDPLAGSVEEVYDSIMKPKPPTPKKARIISYKGDREAT
jgi:hypothetical protein